MLGNFTIAVIPGCQYLNRVNLFMGRKSREKRERHRRRQNDHLPSDPIGWAEADGIHYLMPGVPPSPEQIEAITAEYQNQIRKSPLWNEWIKQFGAEMAEEMLKECRFEIRPNQKWKR
jgi:hypothetical protein